MTVKASEQLMFLLELMLDHCHEFTHSDDISLLEFALQSARDLTGAEGGAVYSVKNQKRANLEYAINDKLNLFWDRREDKPNPLADVPLFTPKDEDAIKYKDVLSETVIHDMVINVSDIYESLDYNFSVIKRFDKNFNYQTTSMLVVPLKNHIDEVTGVLQLFNPINPVNKQVTSFTINDEKLASFLALHISMTINNIRLSQELAELFEAFVDVLATAIDEKSPYTGEHCKRVPIITMAIAEHAATSKDGIFRNFTLNNQERKEIKLAALLHDCGKVTTPIHVVDKATKLETIIDRIKIIETRFEIIKRDAKIKLLEEKNKLLMAGKDGESEELESMYENLKKQLRSDREFIRKCNIGTEFMDDNLKNKVAKIADYKWRDFDGNIMSVITEEELMNLQISKGTLNDQEREIVNYHIIATIKMLERLPYPKSLRRIPEIAAGHHETMDGKGYPNKITREQLSLEARILGLADKFEALTAKDRPYKKGKTLSEALKIMGFMKKGREIDPDLFNLFIDNKIYLDFAYQFLDPWQIDDVDVTQIPGYITPEERRKAIAEGIEMEEKEERPEVELAKKKYKRAS